MKKEGPAGGSWAHATPQMHQMQLCATGLKDGYTNVGTVRRAHSQACQQTGTHRVQQSHLCQEHLAARELGRHGAGDRNEDAEEGATNVVDGGDAVAEDEERDW